MAMSGKRADFIWMDEWGGIPVRPGQNQHRLCEFRRDALILWVSDNRTGLTSERVELKLSVLQATENREEMMGVVYARLSKELKEYTETLEAMKV
jgi:phage terminase Nu1 subunit (DNA packaging protein)